MRMRRKVTDSSSHCTGLGAREPDLSGVRIYIALVITLFCVVVWFLAVDESWFVDTCPECRWSADVLQIRVIGVPIRERRVSFDSLIYLISQDLDIPCHHGQLSRFHRRRWWGLIICYAPCYTGTVGIVDDTRWYGEEERGCSGSTRFSVSLATS